MGYGDDGYYWILGVWVLPPSVGMLWTPGYWGFDGLDYLWNPRYWGLSVGYYGGIDYGFGYFGNGFTGGRWENGHFYYNSAVSRVNKKSIHSVYVDKPARQNYKNANHASFNGKGGVSYSAKANEVRAGGAKQTKPTAEQNSNFQTAVKSKGLFFSGQQAHPNITSFDRIGGNSFNAGGRMMGGFGGGGRMHGGGGGRR